MNTNWQKAIQNVEHYKAIGQTEIFLFNTDDEFDRPWEYVTKVDDPSKYDHMSGMTTIDFVAEHPSGLTFKWYYHIDKRDAFCDFGKVETIIDYAYKSDIGRQGVRTWVQALAAHAEISARNLRMEAQLKSIAADTLNLLVA